MAKSYPHITTEFLENLYVNENMSMPQISEKTGMTPQSVYERFKKSGIKLRPVGEAVKLSYATGRSQSQKGPANHNWKRGYSIDKKGYIQVIINRKSVPQHRLVWEQHYGAIPKGHVIHHLNGIKTDNRIENLACLSRRFHSPKTITEPYKKRIRQLEEYIKSMQTRIAF